MTRIETLLTAPSEDLRGEKLSVDSSEMETRVYRAAAYASAALALLWALFRMLI